MARVQVSVEWSWARGTLLGTQQSAIGTPSLTELREVQKLQLKNLPLHTIYLVYKEETILILDPPYGTKVFSKEEVLTDLQVTI